MSRQMKAIASRESDETMLMALHLREQGHSFTTIARAMCMSKGQIASIMHRVDRQEVTDSTAVKPENQDGALGPLWWKRKEGRA